MPPSKRSTYLQEPPCISEIMPRLFIGNITCLLDSKTVEDKSISAGLSLLSKPIKEWTQPEFAKQIPEHLYLECADSLSQDLLKNMDLCCDFIEAQQNSPGGIAIHCRMGISRSASIVVAYIMRKYSRTLDDSLNMVRERRQKINPNQNFLEQLRVWEELKYEIWEDKMKTIPKPAYRMILIKIKEKKEHDQVMKLVAKLSRKINNALAERNTTAEQTTGA